VAFGQFLSDLNRYQLESCECHWRLQFDFDQAAFERLLGRRLGRTVLLTNRVDWTAERAITGYDGQQQVERVFRGLKDGEWLPWDQGITGLTARSASMRFTACWASLCCSMCIARPKRLE
jgi:hypothetical protein